MLFSKIGILVWKLKEKLSNLSIIIPEILYDYVNITHKNKYFFKEKKGEKEHFYIWDNY